jgi:hypothetical protein
LIQYLLLWKRAVGLIHKLVTSVWGSQEDGEERPSINNDRIRCIGPSEGGWIVDLPEDVIKNCIVPLLRRRDIVRLGSTVCTPAIAEKIADCYVKLTEANYSRALN